MKQAHDGPPRILHVITTLDVGGAELTLLKLLASTDRSLFTPEVVSLTTAGPVAAMIATLGIPVRALDLRGSPPDAGKLLSFLARTRQRPPNLTQTWMYHADLVGGVVGRLSGSPVVWGIHNYLLIAGVVKPRTSRIVRALAALSSHLPARIISCSQTSAAAHVQLGYAPDRITVIPNGFDTDIFRPDGASMQAIRGELGLTLDDHLVGLVARFDPLKDHQTFVRAATILQTTHPDVHFLICGQGVTPRNTQLAAWIATAPRPSMFHLLGLRSDVPKVLASLDVATSTSISEAFPSVVAEAMAAGAPCVATDVGDTAFLLGGTGRLVPPGDPSALAAAWADVLALTPDARRKIGLASRQRIVDHFGLSTFAARYNSLYAEVLGRVDI